jgi:hypothetical protein
VRYVVLVFGLLGIAGAGFLSYIWGTEWLKYHEMMELLATATSGSLPKNDLGYGIETFFLRQRMLPFLLAGVVLGLFGTFVCFFSRRGLSCALLLFVLGAGPGVFDARALVFTGSFIVAALFSVFVRRPRPVELDPVAD